MTARAEVVVLIDALGWTYVEGRDFLCDILPYRQPLKTVLGYSSGAIPTILTGVPPNAHGHWNLFYYEPRRSPFRWLKHWAFLPDALLNHRVIRKALKETGRRILGLGPLFECCVKPRYLHLFDWVEKRNIYAPGGISGAPSIFDRLAAAGEPYRAYSYHSGTDDDLLARARADIAACRARFYFVYLSEMDGFLHHHCGERQAIDRKLAWYADKLRALYDAATASGRGFRFAVCSDHGMTPVCAHDDVMAGVNQLGFSMPGDYLAVYDSTMARFWFFRESAREAITSYLGRQNCGRILSRAEMDELGVTFDDRRFGDLVFLLHPGRLLVSGDFSTPKWMPNGMHGYDPGDRYSDGIFLSDQPPGVSMRTIADIYNWMIRGLD